MNDNSKPPEQWNDFERFGADINSIIYEVMKLPIDAQEKMKIMDILLKAHAKYKRINGHE